MIISNKRSSLLTMLIWLTILTIISQFTLFFVHFNSSDLVDSLVESALASQILHPIILIPLVIFLALQIISYGLFIALNWFVATSCAELFRLSKASQYWLGLFVWCLSSIAVISFNNYFFTDSFFTQLFYSQSWYSDHFNFTILIISSFLLSTLIITAYINFFSHKTHRILGGIFLLLGLTSFGIASYTHFFASSVATNNSSDKPNIIFIGLDSVRPDYVHYFGSNLSTPNIDQFLSSATAFTNAYTPLARTFPAWMSILTAQYPKHNHARTNLADPSLILPNDNIAKKLKANGYETIYGTDEKRFSNITLDYGFDHIIGPDMGVNDFLLGGLSDFPLTNLLINTPLGQFIYPYNYANRAAAITYEPNSFLTLVKQTLAKRQQKPLFLAIHLCVSHWPYTWAHDGQDKDLVQSQRYASSVEAVDQQLGELLSILKKDGLLNHAIVVLLSDHGTTLGIPGDRVISEENYQGSPEKIKWLPVFKASIPFNDVRRKELQNTFMLNTSYGQGTDVLSLKQYHVVLAFKGFGINIQKQLSPTTASLMDITPTILDYLNLAKIDGADGLSLKPYLLNPNTPNQTSRPLFMESGFSVSGIETSNISISTVLKQGMSVYKINPKTGLLYVNSAEEQRVGQQKQRAVLFNDWLLARYPENIRSRLVKKPHSNEMIMTADKLPAFFVLVNLKSMQWRIGSKEELLKPTLSPVIVNVSSNQWSLDSSEELAHAPTKELFKKFDAFYGDET